jgi:hypothetical protein
MDPFFDPTCNPPLIKGRMFWRPLLTKEGTIGEVEIFDEDFGFVVNLYHEYELFIESLQV